MKILKRLAREAVKYGLKPEEIGNASVFAADEDYIANYLESMKGWETPSFYGCTAKHRERALRAWQKLIAKVKINKENPKSTRAAKPTTRKKVRQVNVAQPAPLLGDQEPEDGFDMTVLAPKETGLPFFVYILQDLGLIPDVRVEVAHSTRGSRSEAAKVAIRPIVRVTSGNLEANELALLTSWIELNRDVLINYWDGVIECTGEVLHVLRPIETA